jgi:hypothetical protein
MKTRALALVSTCLQCETFDVESVACCGEAFRRESGNGGSRLSNHLSPKSGILAVSTLEGQCDFNQWIFLKIDTLGTFFPSRSTMAFVNFFDVFPL